MTDDVLAVIDVLKRCEAKRSSDYAPFSGSSNDKDRTLR
jgi:hypothetical protein